MKTFALTLAAALLASGPVLAKPSEPESFRARGVEDEVIYFVLPDRFANGDSTNDLGGYPEDRLVSGFDPTHKGFYHGGDLKGLTEKLDYIQGMGVTAIWFAPIFKNKPVQGDPGNPGSFSAGYHGYWVTDFTQVDPHFGTNEEFEAFVDAAHARGMKVYMDIIANHTADVIRFAENEYEYRSKGDYPYSTRRGPDGAPINEGFDPKDPSAENWARLTDPNYAYTPVVPVAERDVKVPAWLNDPIYYHNRGDSFWVGESSVYGDFVGLDDLFTEHPRVVSGMIDIFGDWIDRYGIDGFRIDTAKHVNPEFWQAFVPAMLERAEAKGIPNFHIFGEIAYQTPDAVTAARVMAETGCSGVKIEGGVEMAETVRFLTQRGIPVMGHVGLTPQAVNVLGGYAARGRSDAEAEKIVGDARALDEAGAFAIVLEGVLEPIAIEATGAVSCPTIGIGASAQCDGQVLVTEDMLGMFERVPRFVKKYADIAGVIETTVAQYAEEVRGRSFPTPDQTYQPKS